MKRSKPDKIVRMLPRNLSLEERFWLKVQKSDGCWLWTGSRKDRGYGKSQGYAQKGYRSALDAFAVAKKRDE